MALRDDLEMEGHLVELVADGVDAEAAALREQHDLIVLDVMLPRQDGLAVCRKVRKAGIRTPIILLTARGLEEDKIVGLQLGADDYVTKPFSPRELVARIDAVLRRSGGADRRETDIVRIGDLVIDFQRHEASRGTRKIELTALEFRILRVFVARRGHVISHDDLITEVWGANAFLGDRVIYTHINNLRQKIEPVPRAPQLLISVRGVGYRFDG
jgi:DNA-binding response OmpR family regulator